ncbi:uncharacterized protein PITG_07915 [Phytophthora infestans T30-4]|uniref:Uncharacterized protein n=1 Tax=Phytophthora infestans (strain T30-4) TaxID=403677 RepID=D0NA50_PHYIT|nr:uncharacterized protein PITG_07915 [Phytophthora infestans T30-4]EEY54304.1 conserved hypothetical protein [Phytophthora infestans T30-4]|eukprot:XP_002904126.1 conserved hypothetical protein [Phytophthora infestans T30-4]
MEQLPLGPNSLHLMQHLHEGQRYDRQPRLLPEVDGVTCLTHHEAQVDIKSIQHQLATFEARSGVKLPGGRPNVGDKDHRRLFLVDENDSEDDMPLAAALKNRRSRPSGVIAPEEIVESLPAARRAVRITQRELQAMRIEREDLERAFVRHRCTLLWQVGEMKRMKKQHDRVTRALSRDVADTAKGLESSRRRTSALQDIMTELEARGSRLLRLAREKSRLEATLEAQGIELPEIDEVCVGDRVKCAPFGTGRVLELRLETRQLEVKLDFGGVGYIQEESVEVLPSDMKYAEAEEELKVRFFEKIGKLVQPNGKLRMLSGAVEYPLDDSDEDSESSDGSEELSSEDESAVESIEELSQRRGKKRRLIMTPLPGTGSKKSKNRRVIEFPASTVPITPFDTGLLISPLSRLPERVAAVGPNALQWLPSYLPKNMDEWEQERYNSLQMKGEIERLRFQLQKSEAQRIDAQQLASDQLESINQLVSQLDKLRENAGLPSGNALNPVDSCPTCGGHKTIKNSYQGRGGNSHRKDSGAQQDDSARSSRTGDNDSVQSDSKKASKRKHSDEASNESSDAAPPRTASKAMNRSLRPRRKAKTTASPKRK